MTTNVMKGNAGELIDRYVDVVADAGVTTFLCCTNARQTNYRSKVWDAYWDGYDPAGPDNQPFLAALPLSHAKRYRRYIDQVYAVYKQGIDYPARVIQRCRQRSVSPWITLRMNDCHYNDIPTHPFHGSFWKDNPHLARKNASGYYATCLDYANHEVRDYYMALIEETLDRYDIDGLELDFMREPYLFSVGKESEGATILTKWMRQVREKVDAASARRGHPIQLGVRVPSHPKTVAKMGLKAVTWAREGLIDLLVVTPRWATLEFDMPIEQWKLLLKGSKTKLAAGLEVLYRPHPKATPYCVTPEMAIGAATLMLSRGADTVYLFNYFPTRHPNWPPETYQKTLHAMGSLDSLLLRPRRVGVTYRDITTPDEKYYPPLPATGTKIIFPIRIGPVTGKNESCELLIGLGTSKETSKPSPMVTLNGKECKIVSDNTVRKSDRLLTFKVPCATLKPHGAQVVKITTKSTSPLTVDRLEILLK